MSEEPEQFNHIIGSTRTIRSAVMVCAYLSLRYPEIPPHRISYRFKEANEKNGFWLADIVVVTYGSQLEGKLAHELVEVCRAFTAGAGEVWA